MSTTNDPIMLNATARQIADELDKQNGYLSMLAAGHKGDVYGSMAQIARIIRSNDLNTNKKNFPIGDQIIMPWKDMDDAEHNTDLTAYQVAWDIVHHGMVELQDGTTVPGMFIQMHLCSSYGVQFSCPQAFYHCDEALPAGTYYFTVNAAYDTIAASSILEFTLTQAVPAGGRIKMTTGKAVTTWSADGTTIIESTTAEVVSSSSGTNLGTTGSNGLNSTARMRYGSNRWKTSAIRQYLNKAGTGWFTSQENFDVRPDQYEKNGFMSGFNDDFLAAIKPIKVTTALNTVDGYADSSEDTFDTFFLPSLQQMYVSPQLADVEGAYFEYWKARLARTSYAGTGSSNVYDAFKIPAINANSAQYVRLRSAYRGYATSAWLVISSGYVIYYGNAYGAYRFSPVCVIC